MLPGRFESGGVVGSYVFWIWGCDWFAAWLITQLKAEGIYFPVYIKHRLCGSSDAQRCRFIPLV